MSFLVGLWSMLHWFCQVQRWEGVWWSSIMWPCVGMDTGGGAGLRPLWFFCGCDSCRSRTRPKLRPRHRTQTRTRIERPSLQDGKAEGAEAALAPTPFTYASTFLESSAYISYYITFRRCFYPKRLVLLPRRRFFFFPNSRFLSFFLFNSRFFIFWLINFLYRYFLLNYFSIFYFLFNSKHFFS